METIIRAPAVSLETRQLRRSSDRNPQPQAAAAAAAEHMPVAAPVIHPVIQPQIHPEPVVPEAKLAPSGPDPSIQLQIEQELANARAQIEQEVMQARALAERDGFAAGVAKGEEAAKKAVAEQVDRLLSISSSLSQTKAGIIESAADAVVEIAYTAICRIIGETVTTRAAVIGMVNQVLTDFHTRDQLVVRLHPQDLELVQQAKEGADAAMLGQQTEWRTDASIRIGGCMVESDNGYLDARLETQLARLCEALLAVRKNRENVGEEI